MKMISRRKMIGISGISAAASLTGVRAFPEISRTNADPKIKIMVVGAHPGDPECGCGGTIALFTAAGHDVVSVYLTRGGAGVQGKTYEEASKIRTDEALKACKILKCRAEFLSQRDGDTELTSKSYDELNALVSKEKPDILFTHWPIDSHRDHRICSMLSYDAWINMKKQFSLYYYEVTSGNETQNFYPTNYIDIGPVISQKEGSCMAHASQGPQEWYTNLQKYIQRFRGIELNCEVAEAFVRHNQNPLASRYLSL